MPGLPDPASLTMDDLRALRARVRRAAEVARLRTRQPTTPATEAVREAEELEGQVAVLTDELIARYAADLGLVDSLLGGAYPADGTRRGEAGL